MPTQPALHPTGQPRPYPPSWIDRLIAWIERLPLPAWAVYLLALGLMVLAHNARQWLDGSAPPGTIHRDRVADAVYSVYFLALVHYLNHAARRAFVRFRPLLPADDERNRRLLYALTVLPARPGYVALVAGTLLALGGILLDPLAFGLTDTTPPLAWNYVAVVTAFNTATFVAAILHGVRQLRWIDRLHAQAVSINLLTPAPLHAFSAVTLRTGLGVIAFAWFMVVQDPTPGLNLVSTVGVASLLLLGAASFVLPLLGMHQRLRDEKQRLLGEVGRRLTILFELLHIQVDAGDLAAIDKTHQAMAALKTENDLLAKLPTWPWQPETPRLFVSAVVLPVVVWLLTSLIERLLDG